MLTIVTEIITINDDDIEGVAVVFVKNLGLFELDNYLVLPERMQWC